MIKIVFSKLQEHYPLEHAQAISWWLLEAAAHKSKLELVTQKYQFSQEQKQQLNQWLEEHLEQKKPLQYILGTVPFGPLTLSIVPPVLIPRPETEEWCSLVVDNLTSLKNKRFTILDMCTGSGCIGLWLAKEFSNAHVYAVDASLNSLGCAQENAKKNGIHNITFIESDLFASIPQNISFDIVVSNPPYVTEEEWKKMDPTITQWEDKKAFVANNEGLGLIERIIKESRSFLKNGSPLIIEIGHLQGKKVAELFNAHGFKKVHTIKDSAEKDRLVVGVYIS